MPDNIKHIVVLMLENHSFDQMLGALSTVHQGLDGIDANQLRSVPDYPDTTKQISQNTNQLTSIPLDPAHEFVNVQQQLADNLSGFVKDYALAHPNCTVGEKQQIMGYYPLDFLPILHTLGREFLVCDRWFSSMPGPTWPNRFFVHSATCKGHVKMPNGVFDPNWHCYDQTTLYDRLCEKNITWRIYHQGEAQSLVLLHQLLHATHYRDMQDFYDDARSDPEQFPQYVFIEPCYSGPGQNDQHPPSDIMKGELLIAKVYNALRLNEPLWNQLLLVVVYDEHGGFYDHVTPPATVAPDTNTKEFVFNQLGIRVPAILVSPYVDAGVDHTVFDHTSLLKYLVEKWSLGDLGRRVADPGTNSIGVLLRRTTPRATAPGPFTQALLGPSEIQNKVVNENQKALVTFSQTLEKQMMEVEDMAAVGSRAIKTLDGPQAQFAVAKDRFERFLQHAKEDRITPTVSGNQHTCP